MDQEIDRLSVRGKPEGVPMMFQSWRDLLFLHWPLHPETLRRYVPKELEIDTYDGKAWIGITPFRVAGLRPMFFPSLPGLSSFPEVNVRTYVHRNGVPGVWFFSLDAASLLAALGARLTYRLPYYLGAIKVWKEQGQIIYHARRIGQYHHPALFEAACVPGETIGPAEPGTLEFFLVERYCLYAGDTGSFRARVFHLPWVLRRVELVSWSSTLIGSQDLPEPDGEPLALFSNGVDVAVWPLERVR